MKVVEWKKTYGIILLNLLHYLQLSTKHLPEVQCNYTHHTKLTDLNSTESYGCIDL